MSQCTHKATGSDTIRIFVFSFAPALHPRYSSLQRFFCRVFLRTVGIVKHPLLLLSGLGPLLYTG